MPGQLRGQSQETGRPPDRTAQRGHHLWAVLRSGSQSCGDTEGKGAAKQLSSSHLLPIKTRRTEPCPQWAQSCGMTTSWLRWDVERTQKSHHSHPHFSPRLLFLVQCLCFHSKWDCQVERTSPSSEPKGRASSAGL